MIHEEVQFRKLMSQLLDGELTAEEGEALARLCAADPDMGARLRKELQLAEMIRSIARGEAGAAEFADQVTYRLGGEADAGAMNGQDLVHRLLDGGIEAPEIDELVRLCWRDPDFAEQVRRALAQDDLLHQGAVEARGADAFLQALETRMWAEQNDDRFVADMASRLGSVDPLRPAGTIAIPLKPAVARHAARDRRRWFRPGSLIPYAGGWAAAAAAVFALYLSIAFEPKPGAPEESVAEVSRAIDGVRWAADGAPVEDRYFARGRYRLESGLVTVQFASGAELSIEAPAEFEVRGEREAFVHTGTAMLTKNTSISGLAFSLNTEALKLGESGETIGLVANSASSAEAVVFDGDAEICLPKLGLCRDLFALEAVKADLGRAKLFDIPFNPSRYAKVWEANAGIEGNTGAVRVALPGQEKAPARDANEVRLSVEKIRFVADRDVEVDTLNPGQFAAVSAGGGRKIDSSGRELRSYLLHWQPKSSPDGTVEASVTFDHDIVGVIFSPERLAGSDLLVGAENRAPLAAGDPGISAGADAGDQILLSDDRRTVNLKLNGSGGADRLEHVRVLVALR
jgi:hypothetical protein